MRSVNLITWIVNMFSWLNKCIVSPLIYSLLASVVEKIKLGERKNAGERAKRIWGKKREKFVWAWSTTFWLDRREISGVDRRRSFRHFVRWKSISNGPI